MNVLQNKTKDIVISVSVKISQLSQKLGTWNHISSILCFHWNLFNPQMEKKCTELYSRVIM